MKSSNTNKGIEYTLIDPLSNFSGYQYMAILVSFKPELADLFDKESDSK